MFTQEAPFQQQQYQDLLLAITAAAEYASQNNVSTSSSPSHIFLAESLASPSSSVNFHNKAQTLFEEFYNPFSASPSPSSFLPLNKALSSYALQHQQHPVFFNTDSTASTFPPSSSSLPHFPGSSLVAKTSPSPYASEPAPPISLLDQDETPFFYDDGSCWSASVNSHVPPTLLVHPHDLQPTEEANPKPSRTRRYKRRLSSSSSSTDSESDNTTTPPPPKRVYRKRRPQVAREDSPPNTGEEDEEDANADGVQLKRTKGCKKVVWTTNLQQTFLEAVQELGLGAMPIQLKARMNIPGLTVRNIASHLHKYRLRLEALSLRPSSPVSSTFSISSSPSSPSSPPFSPSSESPTFSR